MALTLERWIALAVAGCLVAMALIFSDATPKPRAASPRDILAARQARLSTASARAAYRLRLIQLREVKFRPRQPKWNLGVGSLWFDTRTGQLVRAAYRLSVPINIWQVAFTGTQPASGATASSARQSWSRPLIISAVTCGRCRMMQAAGFACAISIAWSSSGL